MPNHEPLQVLAKVVELDERIRLQTIALRNAQSHHSAMLSTAHRTPDVDASIARAREELAAAEEKLTFLKKQRTHWWGELAKTGVEIPDDVDLRVPATRDGG